MILDAIDKQLLQNFQQDFPLQENPFMQIARTLGISEQQVITKYQQLSKKGYISRIGAVLNHKKMGASTLAAISAKEHQVDKFARIINQFDEVNHNYLREHIYNLWFVITAENKTRLNEVIEKIEQQTGCSVLSLPMEKSFHIDLGFTLWPSLQ